MKKGVYLFFLLFVSSALQAQNAPKLVVGIVIDQMRFDYLSTFSHGYCDSGFVKLLKKGSSWQEMHYNYIPTFTGPGHASIYTGTTPAFHGIAANDWYDVATKQEMYCTQDASSKGIGAENVQGMTPKNLRVPTIGDQLKAAYPTSKVYGIALKDRGGILPAGKLADGVFWYDGKSGNMVSSDFYYSTLPTWVQSYNQTNNGANYLNEDWSLLLPNSYYLNKTDDLIYEKAYKGESKPVFPHLITKLKSDNNSDLLKNTPFGNTYTLDFAKALISNEKLGKNSTPDLICISLSSTDYVGHQFGPQSLEVMDTYLRLDRDLASFIAYLNQQIGEGNYTVFLTSDHGAAEHPYHLNDSCFYDTKVLFEHLKKRSLADFKKQLFIAESNDQLYIDEVALKPLDMCLAELNKWIEKEMKFEPSFLGSTPSNAGSNCYLPHQICEFVKNGYDAERSGQISLIFRAGCLPVMFKKGGTTHGSCYHYDTHVPFLLYGKGINHAEIVEKVAITDIAPTISNILGIAAPQSTIGSNLLKR
jgi:predicted AlkP superfamily pyrophosphatase or phosphodiesterase